MDEKTRKIVEKLRARGVENPEQVAATIVEMSDDETTLARSDAERDAAQAERDALKAERDQLKADRDRLQAERDAAVETSQNAPPVDPPPAGNPPVDGEVPTVEQMREEAELRADLLGGARQFLPAEFDTKGATDHEILIAAMRGTVQDAENKSAEYLRARMDIEVERRASEGTDSQGRVVDPPRRGAEHGDEAVLAEDDNGSIRVQSTKLQEARKAREERLQNAWHDRGANPPGPPGALLKGAA